MLNLFVLASGSEKKKKKKKKKNAVDVALKERGGRDVSCGLSEVFQQIMTSVICLLLVSCLRFVQSHFVI